MVVQQKKKADIVVDEGKVLNLELPDFLDRECAFIMGVRKSGSTLLNKIILQLCEINRVPAVALADRAFEQNILVRQWENCDSLSEVIKDGAVYVGFRTFPNFLARNELFKSRKKIFLVRDPRDAVVSEYFSVAYSHSLPKEESGNEGGAREVLLKRREVVQQQSIDEFVLRNAEAMNRTISAYVSILGSRNFKVYRYEDVIGQKRPWIKEMAEFLDLELSDKILQVILDNVDIKPNSEQPTKFIRRVTPGDHKDKLKPETIEKLNDKFSDLLRTFSY